MVLKATPNLLKFKRLQRKLKLPTYAVVGLLETLWWLTAESAPTGNIGRFTDDEIAAGLDWDQDPRLLVRALTDTGWLDEHPDHRLLVHDWGEHAPRWVRGVLTRKGVDAFADGKAVKTTVKTADGTTEATLFSSIPISSTPRVKGGTLPGWARARLKKAVKAAPVRASVAAWRQVLADVEETLNPGTFATWFKPMSYEGSVGKEHFVMVPNLAFHNHLKENHWKLVTDLFKQRFPKGHVLKLVPKEHS